MQKRKRQGRAKAQEMSDVQVIGTILLDTEDKLGSVHTAIMASIIREAMTVIRDLLSNRP